MPKLAMFVDVTKCVGCRACTVACKQWNKLPMDKTHFTGSYQNLPDLTPTTYRLVTFKEEPFGGSVSWHLLSHSCFHCSDAPCVKACPVPGAMTQSDDKGYVVVDRKKCIGCKYCVTACPWGIPKYESSSETVGKCTFCAERVENNLTTACAKSCPTGAIGFGDRDGLLAAAKKRVEASKKIFPKAQLYGPGAYGGKGTNVFYLLKEEPSFYGLPPEPVASAALGLWKDVLRPLTGWGIGATVIGALIHYLAKGPADYEEKGEGHGHS